MSRKHILKKQYGFTLIELITVIAILGILMAVALPSYNGLRKNAGKTVCTANVFQIGRAYLYREAAGTESAEEKVKGAVTDSGYASSALSGSGSAFTLSNTAGACPSGGTYTIEVKDDGTLTVTCSKHGETEISEAAIAVKDLIEAFNKAKETLSGWAAENNDQIMKKFLEDAGNKAFMKTLSAGKVLSESQITAAVEKLAADKSLTEAQKTSVIKSVQALAADQTTVLVPYYASTSKAVITYITTKENAEALESGSGTHKPTSLICYNGTWYLSQNMNYNSTAISAATVTALGSNDIEKELAANWIKIE